MKTHTLKLLSIFLCTALLIGVTTNFSSIAEDADTVAATVTGITLSNGANLSLWGDRGEYFLLTFNLSQTLSTDDCGIPGDTGTNAKLFLNNGDSQPGAEATCQCMFGLEKHRLNISVETPTGLAVHNLPQYPVGVFHYSFAGVCFN